MRFRENQSISRGCTQAVFEIDEIPFNFCSNISIQYKQTLQFTCVSAFVHEVSGIHYHKYLISRMEKNVTEKTQ